MPWKDIVDCLREGEGSQVEFLSSVGSAEELVKYCIAFLNQSGGKIIIGIDDKNNHLVGSNISRNFIDQAIQKIDPAPSLSVDEVKRLDKTLLLITIPPGQSKPYSYRHKYYQRSGAENKRVNKEEIIRQGDTTSTSMSLLNTRQHRVLAYLKTHDHITNRVFRELYKVSHKTAHLELSELLAQCLITKFGQGRNTAYKSAEQ
ncbi:MAG: RNA-binding domain-containing protein [Candidatus Margulisiibacteriota bacterium]